MSSARDYSDPAYTKWRNAVFRRDDRKCRMPKCKGDGKRPIHAHHIRRWADNPSLRFIPSNGITLCGPCHSRVTGKEEDFEILFTGLVIAGDGDSSMLFLMMKYGSR